MISKVDISRRKIVERLMRAQVIVEVKVGPQPGSQIRAAKVIVEIKMLVLDTTPQPLNENVVKDATTTIHTDLNVSIF